VGQGLCVGENVVERQVRPLRPGAVEFLDAEPLSSPTAATTTGPPSGVTTAPASLPPSVRPKRRR
jgi:hypothetical protein